MKKPFYCWVIGALVLALLLPAGPIMAQPRGPDDLPSDMAALYFEETGHNLAGGFLRHWWEKGQLAIFGFPITEEMNEDGRAVQYFERARFEWHPEHAGTQYEVQLGHLGRALAEGRTEPAFQSRGPVSESAQRDYFEQTGHTLSFGFKAYWEENDGLRNFGYPISEEMSEDGLTVQYFERARFEWHPDNPVEHQVLLGHLGRQIAAERGVDMSPAGRRGDATTWTPWLADEIAERRAQAYREQQAAEPTPTEPFSVAITTSTANIRAEPTTASARVRMNYERHIERVTGIVEGENINGNTQWHRLERGDYISATLVERFTPPAPPRTWEGRWIDVNLSTFTITGYEGSTPLYSALITAGRDDRTPLGVFTINRRVRTDIMDSRTVGIPEGHPEFYYLEDVEFSQYITDRGHAIHGNY